jgi:hypothetical protein
MKVKNLIQLGIILALVYWVFGIVGIGCPIKHFTGISCAGCGMTRAWFSVVNLDIPKAFHFHPLFWIPPLAAIGIVIKSKITPKLYSAGIWVIIGLFFIVYIYRLLDPNDAIVTIDIKNGAVWKFIYERGV